MTTGPSRSSAGLEPRRKRILYRAHHRGTRELDILIGRFADRHVETFSDQELDIFEALLEAPEPELMAWLMEGRPVDAAYDTPLFARLKAFTRTDAVHTL